MSDSYPISLASSCLLALSTLFAGCAAAERAPVKAPTTAASLTCQGGVVRSQADAARYKKCTVVTGDLLIRNSPLRDLSEFSKLKRITGALVIENNPSLRNVDALARLTEVGRLEILGNRGLMSLKGLDQLRRAKSVRVRNNQVVYARLGLFGALQEVEGLEIRESAGLTPADVSNLRSRLNQPSASRELRPRG